MDRTRLRAAAEAAMPPGSTRRSLARVGRQVAADGLRYGRRLRAVWWHATEPQAGAPDLAEFLAAQRLGPDDVVVQADRAAKPGLPEVTFVVHAPDGDGAALTATLHSLRLQTDHRSRAVLVGPPGALTAPDHRTTVRAGELTQVLAALAAEGDGRGFLVVLEAGDRIEPDLAFRVAATAFDDPDVDLVHWDDDVIGADGTLGDPLVRPAWSPDVLLGAGYLGRSFALRAHRLDRAGPPDPALGDAAWWDLVLRCDLTSAEVARVPRLLAHLVRRPAPMPDQAVAVVDAHLVRHGRRAEVEPSPTGARVRWALPDPAPHVTVIIPTRHNRAMLETCLPALARTDYPSFDVVIVDNGGRTAEREAWYDANTQGLDLAVRWWDEPFNYGRVNNVAAADARGDVLLFLNDDTEPLDPDWMRELVGWAVQPEIGLVGAQLIGPDGAIQHGGVVLGMHGFADHLFEGMAPGSDSLIGPTGWYRDLLSVTAACVAVTRDLYEQIGGFDERFVLCGSDVVLGLDARFAGRRNVCTPFARVRHLESATRGTDVPRGDFFASYWRYQTWLRAGDPYFSPNLSLRSRTPVLRRPDEPGPLVTVGEVLDRSFAVFRQTNDGSEARWLADVCRLDDVVADEVAALHRRHVGPRPPASINWFVPDIDSPFYGGINTALRMADHLARVHGVRNQFVVMAAPNEAFFRSALAAAFPALVDAPITFVDGPMDPALATAPWADVSIATLWVTAYSVAKFPNTARKFYLIQDFEPMFYPAGTQYALAEEGYRLGLYGLCNTQNLLDIYRQTYGGTGYAFSPAVDDTVFHGRGRTPLDHDGRVRVFVYARPGHWRNCWELAEPALEAVKARFGDDVHIVTAGSWAAPEDLGKGIQHLGLLDYRATGELYRTCDLGVALTVSAHPSYLPLELMACGTPVVAFDNPAGDWILHHEANSLRCRRTVDSLAEAIGRLVDDGALRARLGAQALADIAARHADWDAAFGGIHDFLTDPDAVGG